MPSEAADIRFNQTFKARKAAAALKSKGAFAGGGRRGAALHWRDCPALRNLSERDSPMDRPSLTRLVGRAPDGHQRFHRPDEISERQANASGLRGSRRRPRIRPQQRKDDSSSSADAAGRRRRCCGSPAPFRRHLRELRTHWRSLEFKGLRTGRRQPLPIVDHLEECRASERTNARNAAARTAARPKRTPSFLNRLRHSVRPA